MSDWQIRQGDVLERLAEMPDNSVHVCVTSPPYFALRDYGTAQWEGGSVECDHRLRAKPSHARRVDGGIPDNNNHSQEGWVGGKCGRCGARRIDRQIGLEATPAEFVQTMVRVFREVRRVLRADGTLWLNLGDSYAGGPSGGQGGTGQRANRTFTAKPARKDNMGFRPKNLMMMPARVAIALQDDGWYLRSVIIWNKLNPMPESVIDRPTTAHEYIYLLTKANRYFYDATSVAEPVAASTVGRGPVSFGGAKGRAYTPEPTDPNFRNGNEQWGRTYEYQGGTRNMRSVWTMATEPFPAAHFATFPTEIPRRAILAGTSQHGVCAECGAQWKRVVEKPNMTERPTRSSEAKTETTEGIHISNGWGGYPKSAGQAYQDWRNANPDKTKGWAPTCTHTDADVVPATVLDIFSGAGTTVLVANRLGRRGIGIELNPQYVEMARQRIIGDAPLFAWADGAVA